MSAMSAIGYFFLCIASFIDINRTVCREIEVLEVCKCSVSCLFQLKTTLFTALLCCVQL